ncbi:MAG: MlaD family protein, partial [Saprospiraceae bacterium]
VGSEGLVGNKVLNIIPADEAGLPVAENDILPAREAHDLDEMLETLYKTNNNIAIISEELKTTVHRLNGSTEIWNLLGSSDLADNLRSSLSNVRQASAEAKTMVADLHYIISDVKNGQGSVGTLLKDTAFAQNLNDAVNQIKLVGNNANLLAAELNKTAQDIQQNINSGKGTAHAILRDTTLTVKLNNSLSNIEKGTQAFNANMEALKHNFLFRGYFKKLEKQAKKAKNS